MEQDQLLAAYDFLLKVLAGYRQAAGESPPDAAERWDDGAQDWERFRGVWRTEILTAKIRFGEDHVARCLKHLGYGTNGEMTEEFMPST